MIRKKKEGRDSKARPHHTKGEKEQERRENKDSSAPHSPLSTRQNPGTISQSRLFPSSPPPKPDRTAAPTTSTSPLPYSKTYRQQEHANSPAACSHGHPRRRRGETEGKNTPISLVGWFWFSQSSLNEEVMRLAIQPPRAGVLGGSSPPATVAGWSVQGTRHQPFSLVSLVSGGYFPASIAFLVFLSC
ncbi:hypothetical protein OIU74_000178 [Salix koriyanagi]|uniref:Uncharacterized protein n=1 Tax=Salix koriyanagi TaxID=2511006 RepID=A0A9Q1ALN6_9ROSI|nr:hypothetical protein OIU74_000178 [Salix koriyanagi]